MTKSEAKNCKGILDVLHDRDGIPIEQNALFGEVHVRIECSLAEFKAALAICDTRGWLTGVKGKFAGKLWDINDEGEIARMQL